MQTPKNGGRRRLSGKFTPASLGKENGLMDVNDDGADRRARKSAQQRSAKTRRKSLGRRSLGGGLGTPHRAPQRSNDEIVAMNTNIIAMSNQNKINQKNCFSLGAVTECAEQMINMKGEDGQEGGPEGNNNHFQKASVTIEACTKIYESRVENTQDSCFRLRETLTRNADGGANGDLGAGCGGEDGGDGGDGDGSKVNADGSTRSKPRRRAAAGGI